MAVQRMLMNNADLRIVLVGKTGVGKSATGNTILGEEVFESDISSSSVTTDCKKVRGRVDGRKVAIIDTPGIFDTGFSNEEIIKKIKLCMSLAAPGPHVFLVNIQIGRFTTEEKDTLEIIKGIFGGEASKYTMVLFTYGDQLRKKSIDDFVRGSPDLWNFIQSSSGQYHVFNNVSKDRTQVTALFKKIHQVVAANGGQHYTNEMLQKAERAIQEEQQRIERENRNLSKEEARDKAERQNGFLDALAFIVGAAGAVLLTVATEKCTIQ